MKNKFSGLILILLIASLSFALAHGEEEFAQAEEIIQQNISCDDLTEDQLEILGDYYMEQIHPGEAHEYMDEMMGGEGSESLRQVHINMGLSFYCGDTSAYFGYGMMGGGMGRISSSGYYPNSGRMNSGYMGYSTSNSLYILNGVLVVLVIVVAVILLTRDKGKRRRRK